MRRRKTVRDIRTITKTMEMIAASRFAKAHRLASAAKPAALALEHILRDVLPSLGPGDHALLRPPSGGPAALLVVTSDRGLCGGYNSRVVAQVSRARAELAAQHSQVRLVALGKKGMGMMQHARDLPKPDRLVTGMGEGSLFARAAALAGELMDDFTAGRLERVRVVSQRMVGTSIFRPEVATLLPVEVPRAEAGQHGAGIVSVRTDPAPETSAQPVQYDFLPDRAGLVGALLPLAVRLRLYRLLLEASLSEQIARMMAMRSATENTDDMIRALTLRINRTRQGQITTELSEIIGGAEALR